MRGIYMKRKGFPTRIWRGCSALFGVLLIVSVFITSVATRFASEINYTLKISDSKLSNTEGGENAEYYKSDYDTLDELLNEKYALIREVQGEGSVLLKNNGTLPLGENGNKITLFGVSSVNTAFSGNNGGSSFGNGNIEQTIDMKTCFEKAGLIVNPKMWEYYQNCGHAHDFSGTWYAEEAGAIVIDEAPVSEFPSDNGFAEYHDAAVVVISRQGREGSDLPSNGGVMDKAGNMISNRNSLQLQESELELIEYVEKQFDKVIILINSDNVMQLEELEKDKNVDAILWCGSPGVNGLEGVGAILLGTVNPSGKTVDTYAADVTSSPAMRNFGVTDYSNSGNYDVEVPADAGYVVYQEGIYVGYRYYETRYEDCILGGRNAETKTGTYASSGKWNYDEEMTYPFGYGLSYTTFTQTFDKMVIEDGVLKATVTVTNVGNVPGKDVVELYMQAPYIEGGVEKSAIQLVAFAKTDILGTEEKNNSQTLTLEFDMRYAASYDYINYKTYILDRGDYYFAIGQDVHDALNNILAVKVPEKMGDVGNADKVKIHNIPETDYTTYATSVTGYDVTNRLEHADLNTWIKDSCVYLTRSDWTTYPTGIKEIEATGEMQTAMVGDTYKAGASDTSAIIQDAEDTSLTLVSMREKDYDDPDWEILLNQLSVREMTEFIASARTDVRKLQSISFNGTFGRDGSIGMQAQYGIKDVGKDWETVAEMGTDPISGVAYDEMYGLMLPSSCVQASTWNQELMEEVGNVYGNDSIWTGYSWQRAPGLNVHRTPFSGRNFEYFSEDPMIAFYMSTAQCIGAKEYGLIMAPKHFAFNDQENNRLGICTFFNEQSGREIYLRAFEGAFVEGGANSTMSAYNRVGCIFSGADYNLQTEILRNEWGFKGINITDYIRLNDMEYAKGAEMIMAGTNCICNPSPTDYAGKGTDLNFQNVSKDVTLLQMVRERAHEMLYTFVNSNAMNGHAESSKVVDIIPWWQITLVVVNITFGILFLSSTALYIVGKRGNKS